VHFRQGFRDWWDGARKIATGTLGIERVVGLALYALLLATPTQWAFIGFGTRTRPLYSLTDAYVVGVLFLTIWFYQVPTVWSAWLGTYFSATSVVVLLNIVLFQRLFGELQSPGRSLLLFMCNVAQIIFMFATWYRLGGYSKIEALLKSVLTFATIGYADKMPRTAIAQIATDFMLLAVFLSHLIGQLGTKNGAK
jgi:hypothetical protein